MRNREFKFFKEIVRIADDKHPVWWNGYQFLSLTESQNNEICRILEGKGFRRNERGYLMMPNGMGIKEA